MHIIGQSLHIVLDAFYRFDRDDGWAIASHIALSILMSVFPFLIVVTAIAGLIGSVNLAEGSRPPFCISVAGWFGYRLTSNATSASRRA